MSDLHALNQKIAGDIDGIEKLLSDLWSPDIDATEAVSRYLIRQDQRIRSMTDALHRIVGMCDVPPHCKCGRPNGLPNIEAVAGRALRPETTP